MQRHVLLVLLLLPALAGASGTCTIGGAICSNDSECTVQCQPINQVFGCTVIDPEECASQQCLSGWGSLCQQGACVQLNCTAPCSTGPCVQSAVCGNNITDAGEECDDGNDSNYDDCLNSCVNATCGDGFLNSLGPDNIEYCDDANADNTDGCSTGCYRICNGEGGDATRNFYCNPDTSCIYDAGPTQFVQQSDFQCNAIEDCPPTLGTPSGSISLNACLNGSCVYVSSTSSQGTCLPSCGDGIVNGEEECDDGNPTAGDGCFECQLECGNGILDPGEECDDGNQASGDGCSDTCIIEEGYECPTPGQPCERLKLCVIEYDDGVCAGNIIQRTTIETEECYAFCNAFSVDSNDGTLPRWYQDGICDALFFSAVTCSELTFFCGEGGSAFVEPGACPPVCGNGILEAPEECDDNNTVSGDGCSAECQLERGACCAKLQTIFGGQRSHDCFDNDTLAECQDRELYTNHIWTYNTTCEVAGCCGDAALNGAEECDTIGSFERPFSGCSECMCLIPIVDVNKTANISDFSYTGEVILYTYIVRVDGNFFGDLLPINASNLSVTDDRCENVTCTQVVTFSDAYYECTCVYVVLESDLGTDVINVATASAVNGLPECVDADSDTDAHTVDYEPVCGNGERDLYSCVNSQCVGGPNDLEPCFGAQNCNEQCDDGNVNDNDGCDSNCQCENPTLVSNVTTGDICSVSDRIKVFAIFGVSNEWSQITNVLASLPPRFELIECNDTFPTYGPVLCEFKKLDDNNDLFSFFPFARVQFKADADGCPTREQLVFAERPPLLQCDDGLFCTTTDECVFNTTTCDAECRNTGDPCLHDTVCGDNFCNETTDFCDFVPDDSDCPDGGFCLPANGSFPFGNPGFCSSGCTYTQGFWKNIRRHPQLPDFDYDAFVLIQPCLDRAAELNAQCKASTAASDADCDTFTDHLTVVCNDLEDNFVASYPPGNSKGDPCIILSRQFFAFVMNTFLGAINDMPPYTSLGAAVPDALLEELVEFAASHLDVLDPISCDSSDFTQMFAVEVKQLAKELDKYNTGESLNGPEHCDSEVECAYLFSRVYGGELTPNVSCPSVLQGPEISESGECNTLSVDSFDVNYKINCVGNDEIQIVTSDKSSCGGKNRISQRVDENVCFEFSTGSSRPIGHAYCSGCPLELSEPSVFEDFDGTTTSTPTPAPPVPCEDALMDCEDTLAAKEPLEIATIVIVSIILLLIIIALIYICTRLRRGASPMPTGAARRTLQDFKEN